MAITELAIQPPTIHPVTLIYEGGEDILNIEVTDAVIVSDTLEQVDIGGGGVLHGTYLRLSGPDLVVAAEELRRLADRIEACVLDARQEKIDAERHACWCGTRLDPEELDCGAPRCRHLTIQDANGMVP